MTSLTLKKAFALLLLGSVVFSAAAVEVATSRQIVEIDNRTFQGRPNISTFRTSECWSLRVSESGPLVLDSVSGSPISQIQCLKKN